MSDEMTTQHTPADMRERVAKIVREAMEDARRSERLNTFPQSSMWDYADRILALLRTPRGEGERGLIMRAMLETFPWSPDIRQGHFERAADAVIAALRSEAQGEGWQVTEPARDIVRREMPETRATVREAIRAARRGEGGGG